MIALSKRSKKRILDSLGIMAFVGWIGFLYMRFYHFHQVASDRYDPATGYIYEINNHGCIFYLNTTQYFQTYYPLVVGVVLLITSLLLEKRWKIYKDIIGDSDKLIKYNSFPR